MSTATDCPKCGFHNPAPVASCGKCGVIFARYSPEKQRVPAGQVVVSTATISEPFDTIGPVYAVTTNMKGVLDAAARKLGIDLQAVSDSEVMSALVLGDSVANYQAFPIAFAVCVEQLKRQAARLGADAVVGVKMNFDLDRSGVGLMAFTMQLIGTAVRRRQAS